MFGMLSGSQTLAETYGGTTQQARKREEPETAKRKEGNMFKSASGDALLVDEELRFPQRSDLDVELDKLERSMSRI